MKLVSCLTFLFLAQVSCDLTQDVDSSKKTIERPNNSDSTTISRKLIIDSDAGSDDAVAILNLLGAEVTSSDMETVMVTTVSGNTHVDNVGRNILKILKVAGRLDIPVYRGSNYSVLITPEYGEYFGKDGLGDFHFPDPPSENLIKTKHAVTAIVEAASSRPGEYSLVCLGPLTNIALAIRIDPKFLKNLKEIFILGGTDSGHGNVAPGIEFNFYFDPDAVFIVLDQAEKDNVILNLLTWDNILRDKVDMEWRKNILGTMKTPQIDFINKAERLNLNGDYWYSSDTVLTSVIIDSTIGKNSSEYNMVAETCGKYSRGISVLDRDGVTKKAKNVRLFTRIDVEKFKEQLIRNFNALVSVENGANRTL